MTISCSPTGFHLLRASSHSTCPIAIQPSNSSRAPEAQQRCWEDAYSTQAADASTARATRGGLASRAASRGKPPPPGSGPRGATRSLAWPPRLHHRPAFRLRVRRAAWHGMPGGSARRPYPAPAHRAGYHHSSGGCLLFRSMAAFCFRRGCLLFRWMHPATSPKYFAFADRQTAIASGVLSSRVTTLPRAAAA